MKHLFITTDGNLKTRWHEAFPDALAAMPNQSVEEIASGDVVWLVTTIADWASLIPEWTQRGAVVVALSYSADDREALLALDRGARGYAHTLSSVGMLKQVALVVTNQGIWPGESLLSKVLGGAFPALNQRSDDSLMLSQKWLASLTDRERSVAMAVARGASNKEVARQLEISERTVKAHLSAIFKKLAVRDRLQLILKLSAPGDNRSA